MDHFHEEVVVKKHRAPEEIAYWLSLGLMVLLGLYGMIEIFGSIAVLGAGENAWADLALGVLFGGGAAAIWFFHGRLRTEYEYTFTNGSLDFAKVFNNNQRKTLGSLNVKAVDAFGPVSGSAFNRYINTPGIQEMRWFLNREGNLHYFYFQKDGAKKIIICEPSEELVGLIRQYLPYGVYQD